MRFGTMIPAITKVNATIPLNCHGFIPVILFILNPPSDEIRANYAHARFHSSAGLSRGFHHLSAFSIVPYSAPIFRVHNQQIANSPHFRRHFKFSSHPMDRNRHEPNKREASQVSERLLWHRPLACLVRACAFVPLAFMPSPSAQVRKMPYYH